MRHLIDREGPFLHTHDAIEEEIVSLGRTIFLHGYIVPAKILLAVRNNGKPIKKNAARMPGWT